MCGLTGFITRKSAGDSSIEILSRMTDTLIHRGPDDGGVWEDSLSGIYLGHRRLSIQDLSAHGHQPMVSPSGRYVIAFNGEIYNFKDIRHDMEIEGCSFNGDSDTEVMLQSFERYGLEKSLNNFHGMFAFALWDKNKKRLYLCRDRMGEKPLYYGWQGNTFLFGSELRALREHPDWKNEINRNSIALLMKHNYIPAPHSIFKNINKLEPGDCLTLEKDRKEPVIFKYWSLDEKYKSCIHNSLQDDSAVITEKLEDKLCSVIERQLISDVPVGAFLSGGIDSSLVVSLMQSISKSPVKTFTIGFNIDGYNEAGHAKKISNLLGTEHTEVYLDEKTTQDVIPMLPEIYDEPFADSSQIPTYLISRVAKEKVTVALSGDGGDELFCGYHRYKKTIAHWNKIKKIPSSLRSIIAGLYNLMPDDVVDNVFYGLSKNQINASDRIYNRLLNFSRQDLKSRYCTGIAFWNQPDLVYSSEEVEYAYSNKKNEIGNDDEFKYLQYLDMQCYLPDDILTKVDRASMANSLEVRVPMLDHDIVEYALKIPTDVNFKHPDGKWVLRNILGKYIPEEHFDRKKMGFAVPIRYWLNGDLKEWAESLLNKNRLEGEGYLNTGMISRIWEMHKTGKIDYSSRLWGILMFESWLSSWNKV